MTAVAKTAQPTLANFVEAYEHYDGDNVSGFIHLWETFILSGKDLSYHCPAAADGLHWSTDGSCNECGAKNLTDATWRQERQ